MSGAGHKLVVAAENSESGRNENRGEPKENRFAEGGNREPQKLVENHSIFLVLPFSSTEASQSRFIYQANGTSRC